MIKRIQKPEDLKDIFLELPEQWIQWLTENCNNPKIYIIAEYGDTELTGLIVAIDSIIPPVSDYFSIIFYKGMIKKVCGYLQELTGAEKMVTIANDPDNIPDGFEIISYNIGLVA